MLKFLFLVFLTLNGLHASTKCIAEYDRLQIPHISLVSEVDFFYCFGFFHGKDRAWQMDYFRRVALGTNAEVLGYDHLRSDLMMRLLDLPALARRLWREFPAEHKVSLERYAAGVNAGMVQGREAIEFKELGYKPDAWLPEHSILVLLLQSFDQTRKTFYVDYQQQKTLERWGAKAPELFAQEGLPWENTILKEGEYEKQDQRDTSAPPRSDPGLRLWADFPRVFGEHSGSNNWAVDSRMSRSGVAILANDPHLDLKTPMFWYWIRLRSTATDLIGASLPGVPVIASGTNGRVAWGLTNAYINSADAVSLKGAASELKSLRPLVWVKLWFFKIPFFFKSFETLGEHRPILPLELGHETKLLLRWTGFSLRPEDVAPMLDIRRPGTVAEMDALLGQVGVPAWNFVFADTKGDIGFRTIGKAYRHTSPPPFGTPELHVSEVGRENYLSPEEMPRLLKPERHYLYTANNRHWPADGKFHGGRAYRVSFRGHRIDHLLSGVSHDVESFKRLQCDRLVTDAQFFVPLLNRHIDEPEFESWDFSSRDTSAALPIYRRLMDLLQERWEVDEYALYRMLQQLNTEQHRQLLDAHQLARAEVHGRTWSEIHKVGFFHLSRSGDWVFSPEISGVGDEHSVDPGTAKWNPERRLYEQYSGASMRMIIEMKERPEIHLCLPGVNRDYSRVKLGQAKAPSAEPWKNWRNCRYDRVEY